MVAVWRDRGNGRHGALLSEINRNCGAPATDASVWYEYTAPADGRRPGWHRRSGQLIDLTVDLNGTYDIHAGTATVSGTVTCTGGTSLFSFVYTELRQKRGRYTVIASGGIDVTCDTVTRPWSIQLLSPNGPFGHGDAADFTFGIACGVFFCSVDREDRKVLLSKG